MIQDSGNKNTAQTNKEVRPPPPSWEVKGKKRIDRSYIDPGDLTTAWSSTDTGSPNSPTDISPHIVPRMCTPSGVTGPV